MRNKLLYKIKFRLLSPHPYTTVKETFSFSLFVMLYVAVILFINFANMTLFKSRLEHILTVLIFGFAVGILPVLNSILLKYIIPKRVKKNWKVIGEIVVYQIHFISIGIVNNIIAIQFFPVEKKIINLILNILITYVIGILPVSFMIVRKQNILIKNRSLEILENSKNLSKRVLAPESKICFVESVGNYLEITNSDNRTERLRSTLKEFLGNNKKGLGLHRTHSAYAANLTLVEHISGNAQGMTLTFKNMKKSIPVSRKYVRLVRSLC